MRLEVKVTLSCLESGKPLEENGLAVAIGVIFQFLG
jgi:hypothetical protein